jgi:hypothetical protein
LGVSGRAVGLAVDPGPARLVRIEHRPARHPQDLAGLDIGDQAHGALRMEVGRGLVELVF